MFREGFQKNPDKLSTFCALGTGSSKVDKHYGQTNTQRDTHRHINILIRSGLRAGPSGHFTLEQIQFQIGVNPISHLSKSNCTLQQIQFQNGTNTISHVKELWVSLIS